MSWSAAAVVVGSNLLLCSLPLLHMHSQWSRQYPFNSCIVLGHHPVGRASPVDSVSWLEWCFLRCCWRAITVLSRGSTGGLQKLAFHIDSSFSQSPLYHLLGGDIDMLPACHISLAVADALMFFVWEVLFWSLKLVMHISIFTTPSVSSLQWWFAAHAMCLFHLLKIIIFWQSEGSTFVSLGIVPRFLF